MSHAELCPVCRGAGKVPPEFSIYNKSSSAVELDKKCHGCDGQGWLSLDDDKEIDFEAMLHSAYLGWLRDKENIRKMFEMERKNK